ncbi:hypothetical protein V8F33_003194 [Rhypophila sp. PSN 637]
MDTMGVLFLASLYCRALVLAVLCEFGPKNESSIQPINPIHFFPLTLNHKCIYVLELTGSTYGGSVGDLPKQTNQSVMGVRPTMLHQRCTRSI